MQSYIEITLSKDTDIKTTQISAIISAIHDVNFYTPKSPIALTFQSNSRFDELNSLEKVGLAGSEKTLNTALLGRLSTLEKDAGVTLGNISQFSGKESKGYFSSKDGLGVIGNLNQLKKRAKIRAAYMARKGDPKSPIDIEVQMLNRAMALEKTTPYLKVKQLSWTNQQVIVLNIVKTIEGLEQSSRAADIYGLRQVVPLI
jgi:hypothetical protein